MSTDKNATLARFKVAAALPPNRWIAEYPRARPMAVFCSYVPEEIILAAGFAPVRVRKQPSQSGAWGEHVQSYTCPLARSLLEQAANGELAGFAGAVFAHSCDTMQALADIWRMRYADGFAWIVNVPTRLDGPHAAEYMLHELVEFRAALERLTGNPIGDDDIRAAIALCNRVRALLARLDALRDRMTNAEFYAATIAAQTMPREEFITLAEGLIPQVEAAAPITGRPRAILVGAILDDLTVPALADDLGLRIAGDDLCTGARYM
ncbi:MAG: 2-hydroxyacyl-CoA dehydratase, partial [Anaerolineae bacterium]